MNSKPASVKITRPFGPFIGKFSLPDALVRDINNHVEATTSDSQLVESLDWSHNLVGKVKQELSITDEVLEPYETFLKGRVMEYLGAILSSGVVNLSTTKWNITRKNAWVVRSFAGDFNPAHIHSDASICLAGFLKTPDWADELKEDNLDHAPARGKLCFMHGNTQEWGNNLMMTEPKVGDCYIFPSTLTHFVYPFKSQGERRSMSINFARVSVGE